MAKLGHIGDSFGENESAFTTESTLCFLKVLSIKTCSSRFLGAIKVVGADRRRV